MLSLARHLRGRGHVRRGGILPAQVDQAGRGEQRQPAAGHQQTAVLTEREPPAEKSGRVVQVRPGAAEQALRRRGSVGDRQGIGDLLQPFHRGSADVAGPGAACRLDRTVRVIGHRAEPGGYGAAAVTALERDWPDWLVWTVSPYMGSPEWCARRGDDRKNVLNADSAEHLAEALEDEASR